MRKSSASIARVLPLSSQQLPFLANLKIRKYLPTVRGFLNIKNNIRNYQRQSASMPRRSVAQRYGFALVVGLGISVFILILQKTGQVQSPYMLSIFAVAAAAFFGGIGPAILVAALTAFTSTEFFLSSGDSGSHNILLTLYIFESTLVVLFVEGMRFMQFRAEERASKLAESEARFRLLVDGVSDYALFMVNPSGEVMSWNEGAERMYGYRQAEVMGTYLSLFGGDGNASMEPDLRKAEQAGRAELEGWRVRKDGSKFWANVVITKLVTNKDYSGFAVLVRDLSEHRQAQEQIEYQAFHDTLTDLPNRVLLQERLSLSLEYARRHKRMLAVMFLDLDRFKNINDTLGHEMGDMVLQEVAARLRTCVRDEDTVARYGGDEFILLLTEIQDLAGVLQAASKVIDTLKPAFHFGDVTLHINSSIGIALYPNDGYDTLTLFKNADTALYQAKEAGRDTFKLYSRTMNLKATQRLSLENGLRLALQNNEFTLCYQPFLDVKKEKIVGAEALVRWNHPELGMVFPNEFIPLAEETGLIVQLGNWVLEQVCKQIKEWQDEGLVPVRVAVNLSARQFAEANVATHVSKTLRNCGVAPELIELEITESIAMHSIDTTLQKLESLATAGVHSAIDDFGIGFSSLNYLKQLPIAKLKIDKSFIKHCPGDVRDEAIVKAICTMAHTLKLKVLAEGVETPEQLQFLKGLRCDYVQGYLISRPIAPEKFAVLLQNNQTAG